MSNQTLVRASVLSLNKQQFDFPYRGGSQARLTIQQRGDDEPDVVLEVDRGQFFCGGDRCSVILRFDDGDALDYEGSGASDGSTGYLFVRSESVFMSKVIGPRRLKIEAPFFQAGRRIFEFDISGLQWPPPTQRGANRKQGTK